MAGRTKAAPKVDEDGTSPARCGCGKAVVSVLVAGDPVVVDKGLDARGDIRGMKIGGRWVFTEANVDGVNGPTKSYARHRCPVTRQSDLQRRLDANDTAGPCGRCHKVQVPRRYGPNPVMFCGPCQEAHANRGVKVDPVGTTG